MAGELTRWLASTPVQRDRDRELAVIRRDIDVALAKVIGVTAIAEVSMQGTGKLSMTKRLLEQSAPEDAALLQHIEVSAVMAMGTIMTQTANRW